MRLYLAKIILHVQTAGLDRLSVNTEILAVIIAADNKAHLGVVYESSFSKIGEGIAAGLGIDFHVILEAVLAALNLRFCKAKDVIAFIEAVQVA